MPPFSQQGAVSTQIPGLCDCDEQQIEHDNGGQKCEIAQGKRGQPDERTERGKDQRGEQHDAGQGHQHNRTGRTAQRNFLRAQQVQNQNLRPHGLQKPTGLEQRDELPLRFG